MGEPTDAPAPKTNPAEAFVIQDDEYGFVGGPLEHGMAFHRYLCEQREQRPRLIERMRAAIAITPDEYASWDGERQKAFDAERRSFLVADIPVNTDYLVRTEATVNELVDLAELRRRDQAGGLLIVGRAGVGKTTAMLEAMVSVAMRVFNDKYQGPWWSVPATELKRAYTNEYGDRMTAQLIPVLPAIMPTSTTPKGISETILKSLAYYTGEEELLDQIGREINLTDTLIQRIRMHGVRVIFIDEAHFITDDKKGLSAINHIKSLMDKARVVIVAAGVKDAFGSDLALLEGRERDATKAQLRARIREIEYVPFVGVRSASGVGNGGYETWKKTLSYIGRRVVLLDQDPQWWRDDDVVEYLWKRTDGVFVALVTLLTNAGSKAIGTTESLTIEFLEGIEISKEADTKAAQEHRLGPLYRAGQMKLTASVARATRSRKHRKRADKTVDDMKRSGALGGGRRGKPSKRRS